MVVPGQGCDCELGRVVSRDLVWQGWSVLDKVGCGGGDGGGRAGMDMCLGCTPEFGTPTRGLAVLTEAT